MSHVTNSSWLFLLPQLPPQPSSLRVRVWRRLQQIGAVAMKNAAYALPDIPSALEDFTWLRQEIIDAGGGALLLRAQGLEMADEEMEQLFRDERAADYQKLADEILALTGTLQQAQELDPAEIAAGERALHQFEQRLEAIRGIDYFPGPGSATAAEALATVRAALDFWKGRGTEPAVVVAAPVASGQLWVTRAGVYVDRVACAWIIRRFVDPDARFQFVRPGEAVPPAAIPFDMAGVEFGHHASFCSAETLAQRFRPADAALQAVTELVHDLDLKDAAHGRPEAAGLKRLLDGICAIAADDAERLRLAAPIFDALYHGFSSPRVDER